MTETVKSGIKKPRMSGGLVNIYLLRCTAFVLFNTILLFLLPTNHATEASYRLTGAQYRILLLVVYIPYYIVWYVAFWGYAKLRQYVLTLRNNENAKDANAFECISLGIGWFTLGLPAASLISVVFNGISNKFAGFQTASAIINSYAGIVIAVAAFYYLYKGARQFTQFSKKYFDQNGSQLLIWGRVTLMATYCFIVFKHLDLASLSSSNNIYYVPVLLVLFTIVIPYIYVWTVGLISAYNVYMYGRYLRGILYRQSFRLLSYGVTMIVTGNIFTQYIRSSISKNGHISLSWVIVALYIIFFFTAIGYVLIALAADRLRKIEEV